MKIRKAHAGESPAFVVVETDASRLFQTADPEIVGGARLAEDVGLRKKGSH